MPRPSWRLSEHVDRLYDPQPPRPIKPRPKLSLRGARQRDAAISRRHGAIACGRLLRFARNDGESMSVRNVRFDPLAPSAYFRDEAGQAPLGAQVGTGLGVGVGRGGVGAGCGFGAGAAAKAHPEPSVAEPSAAAAARAMTAMRYIGLSPRLNGGVRIRMRHWHR